MAGKNTLFHPYSDPATPESAYRNLVRAEGSKLWDDTGKEYIDGLASLWLCQVGHGHPGMIDAITKQLHAFDTYNVFPPWTNYVAAEAAEKIASISPHPDGKVYLACSGSEAIDSALKFARQVGQVTGEPDRQIIVRRERGYHGVNFGGTSAQGIAPNRENWGDLVPHFVEVPGDDIEAAASVFAEHGSNIAAFLTEPVQGAGGVYPPPDGYLESIRRLCDDNGSLLIHDEVITGFGRTGEWFASQTFGVVPDMITFAKGVTSGYQPVSGVILSPAVIEKLSGRLVRHGHTYSGHPAGMAAAIANIDIIGNDGLLDRAKAIGTQMEAGLKALADDGIIDSYRGVGAIWAAELGEGVDAIAVRDRMLEAGVIARPIGSTIAFCPPLVITDEEVATMIDVLAASRN